MEHDDDDDDGGGGGGGGGGGQRKLALLGSASHPRRISSIINSRNTRELILNCFLKKRPGASSSRISTNTLPKAASTRIERK